MKKIANGLIVINLAWWIPGWIANEKILPDWSALPLAVTAVTFMGIGAMLVWRGMDK